MIRRIYLYLFVCVFAVALSAVGASAYTPPSVPAPTKNVYEIIAQQKNLSKFIDMINEAGLKDILTISSGEPVTVFAPNNDALKEISKDTMKRIEASKSSLQSFVKYHVIAGSMVSSSAIRGRKASPATANGEALAYDGSDRKAAPKIGDGLIVQMDINATNGVIHIVNAALVPPSLANVPAPAVEAPKPPVPPTAPAAPQAAAPSAPASASETPAAETTSGSAATATTSGSESMAGHPAKVTTTGMAIAPPEGKALPSTMLGKAPVLAPGGEKVPTTGVAKAPKAEPPADSKSFELFGHKFSW